MDPIRRTETWFAHNGLPQFVDDYNSREHIWTRAVPAMIVVLAVQLSSALWSALSSGSRVLPVFTVVVAVLALVLVGLWSKRRRGYWFAPPNGSVGRCCWDSSRPGPFRRDSVRPSHRRR